MQHATRRVPLVGGVVLAGTLTWVAVGLVHVWQHPVIGWIPLPFMALLASWACLQASRDTALGAATRRFWRTMAGATALLTAGIVSNAVDALGGDLPSQRLSPLTMGCYLAVLALVLWSLLRLPTWQRSRSDWIRFGLDTCIMLITSGTFVWHFSLRQQAVWREQTDSVLSLVSIVMLAVVSLVTFVKVAFAGAGDIDRRSIHILAVGTAFSAAFGSMTPFFADKPHLSTTLIGVPITAYAVQLAAVQQIRGGAAAPVRRKRPRRINMLPYLAVAATDALLLLAGTGNPIEALVVQTSAVTLTGLVVARQIVVLRDNRRLLTTVDANLVQMREYQERLTHQATHDALTGVANRALFEDELRRMLTDGTACHVVLLDLDDFKTINDRLGHGMGDTLITAISSRLRETVRGEDMVARLGGDEFVILVPDTTPDDLPALLTRVLDAVQCPVDLGGNDVVARVSIGVTASEPGDSPQELLRRSDVAMYAAKAAGGNRWTWFDPIMDQLAEADARLGADLRQAIARDELFLLYQPIVELPGGTPAGMEALLRWRHPEHGLISPDVFIPLAERNGYIVEVGRWVLERACEQAAAWQTAYGQNAPAKVSINISARQLAEPGFVAEVAQTLDRTGVDRRRLMVEVTETAVLSTGSAMDAVRELHDLGLQVALDDFGTGSSSLSLLVDCPVDYLKVDKSFVGGITTANAQAVIVQSLIGVTEGLRIEAVAEGVESAEQAHRLHAAGYRFAQGYHYARPMTADDVTAMLDEAANREPAASEPGAATG
ncbi:putative bifunctional diguanylate cyclase/phosphodiesterase [Mangrovihabitans endophyticus]|uniref:Diguanylate cyclase (GGDEF) domain-containing protein n=1 Tax=Mangrovihabitans endophyticus TaxID=1751298 RepID=A0A8J3C596_9ACTN|nr:bifunctional diguanylate cyclase/phosphodiesterase [Mangrovihabitans endophyticus]GGL19805.1 hypothetical protein GCM10012284_63010 [Mangrovihabitans endophyticus]